MCWQTIWCPPSLSRGRGQKSKIQQRTRRHRRQTESQNPRSNQNQLVKTFSIQQDRLKKVKFGLTSQATAAISCAPGQAVLRGWPLAEVSHQLPGELCVFLAKRNASTPTFHGKRPKRRCCTGISVASCEFLQVKHLWEKDMSDHVRSYGFPAAFSTT